MGTSSNVRLTRLAPGGPGDLKQAVLDALDSLAPGLRVIGSSLAAPGRGVIDLLAADARGRLALIVFDLEAGPDGVGRALAQWEWLVSDLGALRALMPGGGLDLTVEPRLMIVAGRVTATARLIGGLVGRPELEMFEAALIEAGDRRGVLIDRIAPAAPPPAGMAPGIDPLLDSLPPGEARSLARRILEELRDAGAGQSPLGMEALAGGVDLTVDGRPVATLLANGAGVQVRLAGGEPVVKVTGDEGCREAAATIVRAARGPAATLTPEEIAEFGKFAATSGGGGAADLPGEPRAPAPAPEPPAAVVGRGSFVEN